MKIDERKIELSEVVKLLKIEEKDYHIIDETIKNLKFYREKKAKKIISYSSNPDFDSMLDGIIALSESISLNKENLVIDFYSKDFDKNFFKKKYFFALDVIFSVLENCDHFGTTKDIKDDDEVCGYMFHKLCFLGYLKKMLFSDYSKYCFIDLLDKIDFQKMEIGKCNQESMQNYNKNIEKIINSGIEKQTDLISLYACLGLNRILYSVIFLFNIIKCKIGICEEKEDILSKNYLATITRYAKDSMQFDISNAVNFKNLSENDKNEVAKTFVKTLDMEYDVLLDVIKVSKNENTGVQFFLDKKNKEKFEICIEKAYKNILNLSPSVTVFIEDFIKNNAKIKIKDVLQEFILSIMENKIV